MSFIQYQSWRWPREMMWWQRVPQMLFVFANHGSSQSSFKKILMWIKIKVKKNLLNYRPQCPQWQYMEAGKWHARLFQEWCMEFRVNTPQLVHCANPPVSREWHGFPKPVQVMGTGIKCFGSTRACFEGNTHGVMGTGIGKMPNTCGFTHAIPYQ